MKYFSTRKYKIRLFAERFSDFTRMNGRRNCPLSVYEGRKNRIMARRRARRYGNKPERISRFVVATMTLWKLFSVAVMFMGICISSGLPCYMEQMESPTRCTLIVFRKLLWKHFFSIISSTLIVWHIFHKTNML